MTDSCEHCGAVATGMLFGCPVVVHADDCPCLPKPLTAKDVYILKAITPPPKRFLCMACGTQWDNPGEAEHALDCPANPMTN